MASAKLVIPGQAGGPTILTTQGILALPEFVGSGSSGLKTQFFGNTATPVEGSTIVPTSAFHANAGYTIQLMSPSAGGAGIANLDACVIPTWVAGQSYVQWAVVFDPLGVGSRAYVKFTAGTLAPNTTPPSSDAVNWRLTETPGTSAPSLITGNFITRGIWNSQTIRGDQPASIELLRDGAGATATAVLTGRSADGTTIPDGELRVNGVVSAEGLVFDNINHIEDPTIGGGGDTFAIGQDWYFPLGVATATTPGAARPAKYGGGVFPAHVAGQSTIYTLASDPTSTIMVTAAEAAGVSPATGVLSVPFSPLTKTATSFVVQSLDATGALTAADVGAFQWVIFNPVF